MQALEHGISHQKLIDEALRRGWEVSFFDPAQRVSKITNSAHESCLFIGSVSQKSSWIAVRIADHKSLSYHYLQSLDISVPSFMDYEDAISAEEFLREHTPIVVKPEDSNKSKGVTLNVRTASQLRKAVKEARKYSEYVILQQQIEGQSYRLLVIGGKFFAAAHRFEPFVVGDGLRTVRELILEKNADPRRKSDGSGPLEPISMRQATDYLGAKRLDAVLTEGKKLIVVPIASVSAGGEAADVTEAVHPDYVAVVERIASTLGLMAAGIDVMTSDIAKPLDVNQPFPFLEINSRPGLKMHYYPTAGGKPRNPAAALLDATLGKD
jgi:cyanophycin synthetase